MRPVNKAAGVAELVDAPDSKSGFRKEVRVRFSLPAPTISVDYAVFCFLSRCPIGVIFLPRIERAALMETSLS